MTLEITPVPIDADAISLLERSGLPWDDLRASPVRMFGVRDDGRLTGIVGLEVYGEVALLRSLAVTEGLRRGGHGRRLVAHAEATAAAAGVRTIYLLTTSAAPFFARLGYETISRCAAPAAIASTSQFQGGCCSSATCMRRELSVDASTRPRGPTT